MPAGRAVPSLERLPLTRIEPGGWDNTTFRLGDELVVRLPNDDALAEQVAKEHRWLPVLAETLPFAIPTPVGLGHPGCGFGVTQPADHRRNTGERLGWRWTSLEVIEALAVGNTSSSP